MKYGWHHCCHHWVQVVAEDEYQLSIERKKVFVLTNMCMAWQIKILKLVLVWVLRPMNAVTNNI